MSSTTTLRNDAARSGTNPGFAFNGAPWRKYLSVDLGTTPIGGNNVQRGVRAGVLVVENWTFPSGNPHNAGETHTLVLVATTTNEVFCYGEGSLLSDPASPTPLWSRALGVTAMMRAGSNIAPPIGVCGTPVVDAANRRMFVVAMWDDGSGTGKFSIFELSLDDGTIIHSQELVDGGAAGRPTFNGDTQDQRTAINLVGDWLWFGFAAYDAFDAGTYFGWVVAVNTNDLTKQLYQPTITDASFTAGVLGGGIWGPGGVAAADDGTVFALTGNGPGADGAYWTAHGGAGPGTAGGLFNAAVKFGIVSNGGTHQIQVLDWFQDSALTRSENDADLDFGGSSPLVLPEIDGRQLVAFVPKDGDVFVLDSAGLGQWSTPLALEPFEQVNTVGGDDTKTAIAYFQTPDARTILIASADSTASTGGVAAFEVDATATSPTLTQLWRHDPLRDSFGSPIVLANPVHDPLHPPDPFALVWIVDGEPPPTDDNYLTDVHLRAFDAVHGTPVYDSTAHNDITEEIPHFAPLTSGGNSVFLATKTGFVGLTQFPAVTKTLRLIVDRSTFGMDEVDSLQTAGAATFAPAYWVAVDGVLPSELGLTTANLTAPPHLPTIGDTVDASLTAAERTAIGMMLDAGVFNGPVVPENPALPDEPQGFLFPYAIRFSGDGGFQAMKNAGHTSGLVTLQASLAVGGTALSNSAQIELTTGANPYFVDLDPANPTAYPTWLSFDLRLFKVTQNSIRFGAPMSANPDDAPAFIAQVISNLNNGTTGGETFAGLTQDETASAIEFNPTDHYGHRVFNFALARVRLRGGTAGPTQFPVRVFFRLFQAQNTVSDFDPSTTYKTDPTNKIPLLGIQTDSHGNQEYVTLPCFATRRVNLTAPVSMTTQADPPNAHQINVSPGTEVDTYFGCWLDVNQPQQKFMPLTPPPGNPNGGWSGMTLHSIQEAILAAPHQCLIAEINYDTAPIPLHATSSTSDKLAQRNIAWLDGPNPGVASSRRVTHPVQIKATTIGATAPDELLVLSSATPKQTRAELHLPALNARTIVADAFARYPAQPVWVVDDHTIGFEAGGATILPLPRGGGYAAGLLTVALPAGIRKGERFSVSVRQLRQVGADAKGAAGNGAVPHGVARATLSKRGTRRTAAAAKRGGTWRRVDGQFEFAIDISAKSALLQKEERLLATLRWMLTAMPVERRWYPVLQRYVDYVVGRVRGFGGNPATIGPSPVGWVPGMPKIHLGGEAGPHVSPGSIDDDDDDRGARAHGKIVALVYDHFGDFEGFVLESQGGDRRRFRSRERAVRRVASEALAERQDVAVEAEHEDHVRRLIVY